MESPSKTLGILGGMGPAAGAEFMRLLAVKAPAQRDQEHPIIYMLSDPHIPDRTAAVAGTGPDPTERLRKDLFTIAGWGVDYLAVPCNTAHIFIDSFRDDLPVPLLHIVEETVAACRRQSPKGAWLLATEATCNTGIYQQYARKIGYDFREVTPEMQKRVTEALTLVKAGNMPESGVCMRKIVEELWQRENIDIATACTELPLAYDASGLPAERSVSSLGALSDACLRAIYGSAYQR
ncbi:Aspartate racemase [uncultured delta proteobacterium]|uniref:Aspartate racemase n=1 Tax=uncultured delta proteobacterium TaxID=34034 RepID=A0A212J400_9DELT|nr:Aspartate racemase [uncultured delta proteobacterium]